MPTNRSISCIVGVLFIFFSANAYTASLADTILADQDLAQVSQQARTLIRSGFNAGDGYGEVWIRDLNTFIELACAVCTHDTIAQQLAMFYRFQGKDGNIIDGFIPKDKANVDYDYIRTPAVPDYLGHKNTVETDQESSLVQATWRYVKATGKRGFLSQEIEGQSVLARMDAALRFLLNHRFTAQYGLIWGATTADWGDVQPEHSWGVVLDENTHRAIDIYDNAMFLIAIRNLLDCLPEGDARRSFWEDQRDSLHKNIRKHLWDDARHKFIPHIYLEGSPFPKDFDESACHYHGGTATAIEAGLLTKEEIRTVFAQMVKNKNEANAATIGLTIYPPYPKGTFQNKSMRPFSYQNGGDWTWFGGRMIQQLVNYGFAQEAYDELRPMTARVLKNKGFFEWYTCDNTPRGSASFRGSAGVLAQAIELLQDWAQKQKTAPPSPAPAP